MEHRNHKQYEATINRQLAEIICRQYWNGEITTAIAFAALDAIDIRGGFDRQGFTGYDYRNQQWIVWNA